MRRAVSGFTLIELLVVIAIIAILAAILFPIFNAAKEKAKQTNCMNNIRQLTQAYLRYVDDYSGFMPPLRALSVDGSPWSDITRGALWSYYRSKKMLVCPIDAPRIYPGVYPPRKFTFSYSLNGGITWGGYQGYFDGQGRQRADGEGMPISYFVRPTRDIMWVEENTDLKDYETIINDETFINVDRAGNKHNKHANVSFIDGHMGQIVGMKQWDTAKWPDGKWMFFEKKL